MLIARQEDQSGVTDKWLVGSTSDLTQHESRQTRARTEFTLAFDSKLSLPTGPRLELRRHQNLLPGVF